MQRVTRLIPALPIPLVAEAMLAAPEGLGDFDLKERVYRRMEDLHEGGAMVVAPLRNRARAVETALNMLKLRRLVREENGRWHPTPGNRELLEYYANSLSGWTEPAPG
jgi:hypothetical protein